MSNNSLLLVDPDFKADTTANCDLLLKITNDSLSFAIIDQDSKQVKVIFDKQGCDDIHEDLATAFKTEPLLAYPYGVIKAAVHTSSFIFIPQEWINTNDDEIYTKFLGSEGKVYRKNHDQLGFNTLFSLDEQIAAKLPKNTILHPQSAPLLALNNQLADDALLIDFTASSFNALLIKDKKVYFQNHYDTENAEEFNYFLLLMIEQLGLNETIPVYLQGIINEDDAYYNTLLKYFNNLYFFLPSGKHNSELLADMPKHYFSGLLALDLCE